MEKKPYPSELQDRFIVRFPEGMRDQIAEAAKANSRSMNAEIVIRLHDSFATEDLARGDEGLNDLISRTVKHTMESMLKSGWYPRSGVIADGEADNLTWALVAAEEKAKAEAPTLLSGSGAKNKAGAQNPLPDAPKATAPKKAPSKKPA